MALSGATILQVIPALDAGGAERTTIEIAAALREAGATALVASAGGRMERELKAAGGELISLPTIGSKSPVDLVSNALKLSRLMLERRVDLVHARSRAPAWSALWAARQTGRKFVTTYHGIYTARTPLKRAYNSVMARGDAVIANSEYTASHVSQSHPWATDRIVAIPRGVDIEAFSPAAVSEERRKAIAEAWRVQPGETVILLPARLTGWKGHRDAISAAARLTKLGDGPKTPWRMIFAGDAQGRAAYEEELTESISRSGLGERVTLVGHCADMPAAFAVADIVIAPSREPEAFGRVAAEAGAMGRPVVGSNIGGQREIIVDGVTGLLIPPEDPAGLANALSKLLAMSPEARAAMGASASVRVREKFTAAALQKATLAVYDRLIGRSA